MWDDKVTVGFGPPPNVGCYYVDEVTSVANPSITVASNAAGRLLRTNLDVLQSTSFISSDAHLHKITTDDIKIKGDSDTSYKACKHKREHYKPKFTL